MDKLKELFQFKVWWKDGKAGLHIGWAWFVVALAIIWWGF